MKKILLLGVFLLCVTFIQATEVPFQKAEIKSIMRKVADWQIANPHPAPEHDDLNWPDRKSTRLNSSHRHTSRMPSSA